MTVRIIEAKEDKISTSDLVDELKVLFTPLKDLYVEKKRIWILKNWF